MTNYYQSPGHATSTPTGIRPRRVTAAADTTCSAVVTSADRKVRRVTRKSKALADRAIRQRYGDVQAVIKEQNKPPIRLRDFAVGQTVILAGVEVPMRIAAVRPDGYIDLTDKGRLRITASACHLCSEAAKK